MPSFTYWLCGFILLVLACRSEPRHSQPTLPDAAKAFPNLPLPPNPELVSRAGSADALQLTVFSPAGFDEVTELYRKMLGTEHWRLVSDKKNADGSVVLYAEQNGPPLWVRIWKLGDRGTMVELTGAVPVVDSVKAKPAAPASAAKDKKRR
jgi:hypothetical protein